MTDPFINDPLLRRLRDLSCGNGNDPCPWTKDDAAAVLDRFTVRNVPEGVLAQLRSIAGRAGTSGAAFGVTLSPSEAWALHHAATNPAPEPAPSAPAASVAASVRSWADGEAVRRFTRLTPGQLPFCVVIESPYGSNLDGSRADEATVARNVRYLHRCMLDSLVVRGEAPFASHAIYPLVLADAKPEERRMGLLAGFAWGASASKVAVYVDFGITPGMREGIERAATAGIPIEMRWLPASVLRAVLAG